MSGVKRENTWYLVNGKTWLINSPYRIFGNARRLFERHLTWCFTTAAAAAAAAVAESGASKAITEDHTS